MHSLPRPVNSFWKLWGFIFANISYGALCMISIDSVANFNSHAVSIAGDNSLLVSFPDHLGTRLGTRLERMRTLYMITLDSVARLPSTLHHSLRSSGLMDQGMLPVPMTQSSTGSPPSF